MVGTCLSVVVFLCLQLIVWVTCSAGPCPGPRGWAVNLQAFQPNLVLKKCFIKTQNVGLHLYPMFIWTTSPLTGRVWGMWWIWMLIMEGKLNDLALCYYQCFISVLLVTHWSLVLCCSCLYLTPPFLFFFATSVLQGVHASVLMGYFLMLPLVPSIEHCSITLHLLFKLNLSFCFFQICCSTYWSSCLGNECDPHWCTRYSVRYIWQRVDWNLSWLVRVS